jgi:hypothetical protein
MPIAMQSLSRVWSELHLNPIHRESHDTRAFKLAKLTRAGMLKMLESGITIVPEALLVHLAGWNGVVWVVCDPILETSKTQKDRLRLRHHERQR